VLLRSRADRDRALEAASVLGVQARPGFDPPLHHHPAFVQAARGSLAVTDDVASRLLLLPCANALDEWQLERIGAVLDLAAELR
jgi:dTDP-4-amino-4,6-dideoxygalactose transaminase